MNVSMFKIDPATLDFELPEHLIAQTPPAERDQARLLVLHRKTGQIEHRLFSDLRSYLVPGDVLVLNNAKVSRAKLMGRKPSGGKVEAIFVEKTGDDEWRALVRPLLKEGTVFHVGSGAPVTVAGRFPSGEYRLATNGANIELILEKEGKLPLPPYIKREENDPRHFADQSTYQTVYASATGSVAAPTAGLHFSDRLLAALKSNGILIAEVLLHVGWGTFRPIADTVDQHEMLAEKFEIPAASLAAIEAAKREKRRIISVGTTSTRSLESLPLTSGETKLFIKPGFQFKQVDALITNLHVPRSTPVSLTAAFAGFENLERCYAEAIEQNYNFYSYGDAMLIL